MPPTVRTASLVLALGLVVAGCSPGEGPGPLADLDEDGTEAPSTDAAAPALTPTGPGCDALPEEGAGSAAALAELPTVDAVGELAALNQLGTLLRQTVVPTTLEGLDEMTLFAPTDDEAFAAIADQQLSDLASNTGALTDLLTLHVVDTRLPAADLAVGTTVTSLLGQGLDVVEGDGPLPGVRARETANVVCADIPTADGVIHLVDGVLFPDTDEAAEQGSQEPDPGDDETLGD